MTDGTTIYEMTSIEIPDDRHAAMARYNSHAKFREGVRHLLDLLDEDVTHYTLVGFFEVHGGTEQNVPKEALGLHD